MEKYKHKKLEGVTAEKINLGTLYKITGLNILSYQYLPAQLIENSNDWELIKEQPFKNGDVVKHKYGAIVLLTDYKNNACYGFDGVGQWFNNDGWYFKDEWTLATSEEWLEALTKEAVERGFDKDKDLKVNFKYVGNDFIDNLKSSKTGFILHDEYLNELSLNGRAIMRDGIWAEVIKKETLKELAEKHFNFVNNRPFHTKPIDKYIEFFTENKETINRLSK